MYIVNKSKIPPSITTQNINICVPVKECNELNPPPRVTKVENTTEKKIKTILILNNFELDFLKDIV